MKISKNNCKRTYTYRHPYEEVLKREYNLLGKTRLSHIWHMTIEKNDKPIIITDGALNVMPNVKTKMHILKNVINFSNRIGV